MYPFTNSFDTLDAQRLWGQASKQFGIKLGSPAVPSSYNVYLDFRETPTIRVPICPHLEDRVLILGRTLCVVEMIPLSVINKHY